MSFNLAGYPQLRCTYTNTNENFCTKYPITSVKCKNLKYKTVFYPRFECTYKGLNSKTSIYSDEVNCENHTFKNDGKETYYYVKNSCFLKYTIGPYFKRKANDDEDGLPGLTIFFIVLSVLIASISIVSIVVWYTGYGNHVMNWFNSFRNR